MSKARAKTTLDILADNLMETYGSSDFDLIQYRGGSPLPNKETVTKLTDGFFSILYPGYWGQRPNTQRFPYFLKQQRSLLREGMAEQIDHALTHDHFPYTPNQNPDSEGHEVIDDLLDDLPKLRMTLNEDIKAAFQADPAATSYADIVMNYPGTVAVTIYRLAHILHTHKVPLIPRMMTEYAHSKTGIDIHPGAKIGPGFFIDHGTGTVIGETSVIGRNVTLYQGVTLGAINFDRDEDGRLIRGGKKRHPTLEDHVIVYANATILGGDTVIGRNSTVGANVWLMHSLPPEHIAKLEKREVQINKKQTPPGLTASEIREMRLALITLGGEGCPHCD